LRGYAQLLLRHLGAQGVLDVKLTTRALNVIDQSSGRLDELVTRLLDVSRIQAGTLALDARDTDVVPLVWRTVEAAQLRTTDHRLKVRAPASLWASIDALRFEQVVSSLLDNAVKFSPTGTRIDVVVSTDGTSLRLTARDRGEGIRPEKRAHLFDSFREAEQPDHLTRRRGIGLGLYVSREIVHLHGGRVDVQSPPGGGTRFVVTLPNQVRGSGRWKSNPGRASRDAIW
jgi:signal transduction histidine kinase